MWAIILYLSVIFTFVQGWEIVTFGLVLVFSFWYNAVALIPLAILLDAYFGNFNTMPTLSFLAVVWFILVEYLRPKVANFRGV